MKTNDLHYICASIGNLSGIPVRIYKQETEQFFYSMVRLPKDPMLLHKEDILSIKDPVSYYATRSLNYYGILNVDNKKIIIGPTRLIPNQKQDLHRLALLLEVSPEEIPEFITAMQSIVGLPIERLLQMLCLLNHFFTKEKINLKDISIYESHQNDINRNLTEESSNILMEKYEHTFYRKVHNTYQAEATMLDLIRKGNVIALEEYLESPTAVQSSLLANDPIRQRKNTFISTATLASRAAIRGGMDQNNALSLAESYIQKCELLDSPSEILNLQYHMVQNFTQQVNQLQMGKHTSKLITDVANYIQKNLSKPITTQEIADALFLSRPYLSKKFHEETGMTMKDFIMKHKIDEAKRLLKYTNKPLLSIAIYLGFSSQSHFTRTFKQVTGKTPGDYR